MGMSRKDTRFSTAVDTHTAIISVITMVTDDIIMRIAGARSRSRTWRILLGDVRSQLTRPAASGTTRSNIGMDTDRQMMREHGQIVPLGLGLGGREAIDLLATESER